MNRNTMRMVAVSAVAAFALGGASGLAQASPASVAAPQTVSVTQQAEGQQAARTLLASPLAAQLSVAERAEMTKIASGEVGASRWSAIRAAFSKVGGFARPSPASTATSRSGTTVCRGGRGPLARPSLRA